MMRPADDYVRNMFAQQILKMANDDQAGWGWHVVSLNTGAGRTQIVLDTYVPLKSLDSNGIQSGCSTVIVDIVANFLEG